MKHSSMSAPYPKHHVIELVAAVRYKASPTPKRWNALSDGEQSVWSRYARAALNTLEPAANWNHFASEENEIVDQNI